MVEPAQQDAWIAGGGEYEYRVVTIGRQVPPGRTHRMLTEQAEYGRWEMTRSAVYWGGARRVWLRRKVLRVRASL